MTLSMILGVVATKAFEGTPNFLQRWIPLNTSFKSINYKFLKFFLISNSPVLSKLGNLKTPILNPLEKKEKKKKKRKKRRQKQKTKNKKQKQKNQ